MVKSQQENVMKKEISHKKKLGKNTLANNYISKHSAIDSLAGTFYHYTSPEGLLGILRNRQIFFTDCQFLNDYRERLGINKELDLFWNQNKGIYEQDFYNLMSNIRISEYEDLYYDINGKNELSRYFVMSTSKNSDSLSMWKYYAKNGAYYGYNIGLFVPALDDEWIDEEIEVVIENGEVIYSSDEKQSRILKGMNNIYKFWLEYEKCNEINLKIARDFKEWISYISVFFKDESFASEEEYRFVVIAPKNKLNKLFYKDGQANIKMYDFRIVNGVAVPYLKIPICSCNSEEFWGIDSIGISPTQHHDQMANGIIQLTNSLGYELPSFIIRKSNIPLRY